MPNLPTWRKVNPADSPIMILRVNSEMMPLIELSDYAETILARQLSQVNGVGQIFVVGQQRPAIRIQAQPEKLAAYQLTLADLRQSLQSASVNLAKGALYGEGRVSTLAANDQLFNASDYDDLVVAYRQGAPVFLATWRGSSRRPRTTHVQAWPNGVPGGTGDPPPAWGEHRRYRRRDPGRIAAPARDAPGDHRGRRAQRSYPDHPLVAARGRTDPAADHWPGGAGDGPVPPPAVGRP